MSLRQTIFFIKKQSPSCYGTILSLCCVTNWQNFPSLFHPQVNVTYLNFFLGIALLSYLSIDFLIKTLCNYTWPKSLSKATKLSTKSIYW